MYSKELTISITLKFSIALVGSPSELLRSFVQRLNVLTPSPLASLLHFWCSNFYSSHFLFRIPIAHYMYEHNKFMLPEISLIISSDKINFF